MFVNVCILQQGLLFLILSKFKQISSLLLPLTSFGTQRFSDFRGNISQLIRLNSFDIRSKFWKRPLNRCQWLIIACCNFCVNVMMKKTNANELPSHYCSYYLYLKPIWQINRCLPSFSPSTFSNYFL